MIVANCTEAAFQGVELRTTHAHGVEDMLTAPQRDDIRRKFADGGITAYGIGTACEFHSSDSAELQSHIDGAKRAVQLAADLGMEGVKVRPNGLPDGVTEERTLEQVGLAVRDVSAFGADHGIRVWLEVHGTGTCRVDRMRKIMDIADHHNALLTYNCNRGETDENSSCLASYELLKDKIGCVHIQEIWDRHRYPYGELLHYLKRDGYTGWTSYEGPGSSDAVFVMKCYRRLWELMLS